MPKSRQVTRSELKVPIYKLTIDRSAHAITEDVSAHRNLINPTLMPQDGKTFVTALDTSLRQVWCALGR